jgi:hypothetical protein
VIRRVTGYGPRPWCGPMQAADARTLRVLTPLALERETIAGVLEAATGRPCSDCELLSTLVDRVVTRAGASPIVRDRLDAALADALAVPAACLAACPLTELPLGDLAAAWARCRAVPEGPVLAAILWLAARNNDRLFRRLERRVAAEVEALAARKLGGLRGGAEPMERPCDG